MLLSCAGGRMTPSLLLHAGTSPHYLGGKWSIRTPGLGAIELAASWGRVSTFPTKKKHSWIISYHYSQSSVWGRWTLSWPPLSCWYRPSSPGRKVVRLHSWGCRLPQAARRGWAFHLPHVKSAMDPKAMHIIWTQPFLHQILIITKPPSSLSPIRTCCILPSLQSFSHDTLVTAMLLYM